MISVDALFVPKALMPGDMVTGLIYYSISIGEGHMSIMAVMV